MSDAKFMCECLRHMGLGTCNTAANLIEQQAARIATLEQELRNIANADTVEWDDPTEFEAWAKSRARWVLANKGE